MLERTKTPILISMPRNGSHYVAHFIREIYKHNGLLPPVSFTNEFLDVNPTKPMQPISKRIEFLEYCRNTWNLNMFMNVHSHQLMTPIHIRSRPNVHCVFDWFQEFYSGYQIVILRRKYLWKAFISWLFHKAVRDSLDRAGDIGSTEREKLHNWHNKTNIGVNVEDTLKSTVLKYKPVFKWDAYFFGQYCTSVRYLNEIIISYYDQTSIKLNTRNLWLEDCNDESLKSIFFQEYYIPNSTLHGEWTQPYKPFTIKYETYFGEHLAEIQDKYNEQYEKEFKYYGYTN